MEPWRPVRLGRPLGARDFMLWLLCSMCGSVFWPKIFIALRLTHLGVVRALTLGGSPQVAACAPVGGPRALPTRNAAPAARCPRKPCQGLCWGGARGQLWCGYAGGCSAFADMSPGNLRTLVGTLPW